MVEQSGHHTVVANTSSIPSNESGCLYNLSIFHIEIMVYIISLK